MGDGFGHSWSCERSTRIGSCERGMGNEVGQAIVMMNIIIISSSIVIIIIIIIISSSSSSMDMTCEPSGTMLVNAMLQWNQYE